MNALVEVGEHVGLSGEVVNAHGERGPPYAYRGRDASRFVLGLGRRGITGRVRRNTPTRAGSYGNGQQKIMRLSR